MQLHLQKLEKIAFSITSYEVPQPFNLRLVADNYDNMLILALQ